MGLDTLVQDPPELEIETHVQQILDKVFNPRLLPGLDVQGRPILYMPYGRIDLVALERQGVRLEHLVRRYVVALERMRIAVHAAPNPLAGHLQIADVAGANVPTIMRSWHFFRTISAISQENYPDLLGCCCVVRAPTAGKSMFSMAQRLMSEEALSKVQLHCGDSIAPLRSLMSAESLPHELEPVTTGMPSSRWRCLRCCEPKPALAQAVETDLQVTPHIDDAAPEEEDWLGFKGTGWCGGVRDPGEDDTTTTYSLGYSLLGWKEWTWESMGCASVRTVKPERKEEQAALGMPGAPPVLI